MVVLCSRIAHTQPGACLSPPHVLLPAPGVGLDFNTQLVEAISKVRGALYFSVHSPGEFQQRLVQDFDFAVTVRRGFRACLAWVCVCRRLSISMDAMASSFAVASAGVQPGGEPGSALASGSGQYPRQPPPPPPCSPWCLT